MACYPGQSCYENPTSSNGDVIVYAKYPTGCEPEGCLYLSDNVCYIGASLSNSGGTSGETLTVILQKLDNALSGIGISTNWGDIEGTITDQTDLITYLSENYVICDDVPSCEEDPIFTEWLSGPPNISIFNNDSGYSTVGFANPMTTGGDIIYGGASGIATRLANGSIGQVLTSSGGTSAPTWTTLTGTIGGSTGSLDNAILRANGTGGLTLQNSSLVVDDFGNITVGVGVTGTQRTISAEGSGSNIDIGLFSKGTGNVIISSAPGVNTNILAFPGQQAGKFIIEGSVGGTTATSNVLQLLATTTTTPDLSMGVAIEMGVETSVSNNEIGVVLKSLPTDITPTSEKFDFTISTMSSGGTPTEKFRFASTGALGIAGATYGTLGQVLTSAGPTSSPTWETPSIGVSGSYTPTLADVTNSASRTLQSAYYSRNGNIVTCSVAVAIDPTAGGNVAISITLPVASDLTGANDVIGSGNAINYVEYTNGTAYADTSGDKVQFSFKASADMGADVFNILFQYEVK